METAATQVRSDDSTAEVENSRSLISSPQNVDTNATQPHVTIVGPQDGNPQSQEDGDHCLHRGTCCVQTRHCVESSHFSFTIGVVLFVIGIVMIGVTSNLPDNNFFLVGPFCLAGGSILLIRGCINELAKRQQARENREREERQARRHMSAEERPVGSADAVPRTRSERYEAAALSAENMIVPPDYEEVVHPKPTPEPPPVESQANFTQTSLSSLENSTANRSLSRFYSIQSQTSFHSLVDVGVDTSDLPTDLDTISQAPPSYYQVLTPTQTETDLRESSGNVSGTSSQTVTVFLPSE